MSALRTQAIAGSAAAVLLALAIAAAGPVQTIAVLALAGVVGAAVASAAQARRLREERRLVYRPVYARRQSVQRRLTSDD